MSDYRRCTAAFSLLHTLTSTYYCFDLRIDWLFFRFICLKICWYTSLFYSHFVFCSLCPLVVLRCECILVGMILEIIKELCHTTIRLLWPTFRIALALWCISWTRAPFSALELICTLRYALCLTLNECAYVHSSLSTMPFSAHHCLTTH